MSDFYFSLRTSETDYLNEAFSFYQAIRGRAYYSRAAKEDEGVKTKDGRATINDGGTT